MDRKSMWHAIHTSETGRLENLDQLTPFGKELLYTFVHLLLQGYNGQTLTEPLKTYQWLENNPNVFDVSQRNVQRILSKYVLCLNGAFCYLCNLTKEEAQMSELLAHGKSMAITRSLSKEHELWDWVEENTPPNKIATKLHNR